MKTETKDFYDNFKNKKKLIIAHRGFRAIRPENTLCAFKACLNKCDFIEFDVNISKDGIPVVIHDSTLIRTSNIKDIKRFSNKTLVHELSLKELKSLNFSKWFKKDDPFESIKNKKVKKSEIKKETILTLEEALIFCKENKVLANIEIKDLYNTPHNSTFIKKILDIIKKLKMENNILLSSFNHAYLRKANKLMPGISKAVLVEDSHPNNLFKYLKDLNICAYNCDDSIITKEIVTYLKKNSYKVNVFTVNDKKRKEELFSWGVDGIYTDFL